MDKHWQLYVIVIILSPSAREGGLIREVIGDFGGYSASIEIVSNHGQLPG